MTDRCRQELRLQLGRQDTGGAPHLARAVVRECGVEGERGREDVRVATLPHCHYAVAAARGR